VAQDILHQVRDEVITRRHEGRPPLVLAEVRIGDWPFGDHLQARQEEACRFIGVGYQVRTFPLISEQQTILRTLAELNADPQVSGILMQGPTAAHTQAFTGALAPEKDVDGMHPLHLGRLITNKQARRIIRGGEIVQLLKHVGMTLVGARVMCIGNASGLAGVVALLCLHEHATISAWRGVTAWPADLVRDGDVLVLDADDGSELYGMALKPGAVVIDTRRHAPGWMPSQEPWFEAVSLFIPMPGGMGPATIARRLAALVALARTPDGLQATG
jgi:methylenetetrahydrofolate dehydrogenase (NADP+) / methenyltetrahydrofolate cyclohydrolase